jgi:hypothetical protein
MYEMAAMFLVEAFLERLEGVDVAVTAFDEGLREEGLATRRRLAPS